jgi:hypothetical protein
MNSLYTQFNASVTLLRDELSIHERSVDWDLLASCELIIIQKIDIFEPISKELWNEAELYNKVILFDLAMSHELVVKMEIFPYSFTARFSSYPLRD